MSFKYERKINYYETDRMGVVHHSNYIRFLEEARSRWMEELNIPMEKLENEGFTITVHGKGTYVAATNTELLLEEQKKEVEADLEKAIQKGRRCGISDEDIKTLFELILEG